MGEEKDMMMLPGGRLKSPAWRPFTRPADWAAKSWRQTHHLMRRSEERDIPAATIEAGLQLADLYVPLDNGRMKLGFSRRAIRRQVKVAKLRPHECLLDRLVMVVSDESAVLITAWLDDTPRQIHARAQRDCDYNCEC